MGVAKTHVINGQINDKTKKYHKGNEQEAKLDIFRWGVQGKPLRGGDI